MRFYVDVRIGPLSSARQVYLAILALGLLD